jgi:ParB family chromosome partitioning protein
MRRDLFSDGENGVFIDDVVLLETLVAKKLEKAAQKVSKEGWKWVEIVPSFHHADWSECERRHPKLLPLLPEQQTELDALTAELETLNLIEEPSGEEQARLDAINALDTGWLNRLTV